MFAAMVVVSLIPIVATRYPQCVDYLNHLVRLFILTAPDGAPIHRYYAVHWHPLSNLGLEMVAIPLAQFLSLESAMKAVWGLCVVGVAAGVWFLHRSLYPRTQVTLLFAAPMLLNLPLTVGLLNFTLGVALMLFATGLWLRWRERLDFGRLALFNGLSALTLICHVAAGAALALSVGLLAFRRWRLKSRDAFLAASGFVLPVLAMAAVAYANRGGHGGGVSAMFYSMPTKQAMPASTTYVGFPLADLFGTALVCAGLPLTLYFGGAKCHSALVLPLLVWVAVLIGLPFEWGVASYIDIRLAVVAALLLVASMGAATLKRGWATALMLAVLVVVPVRVGILVWQWHIHDGHVESFRRLGAQVPFGAKVLVVEPEGGVAEAPCPKPYHWVAFDEHIPTLLAIDRAAFVSTVFADSKMQPIRPAPAVVGYARPNAGIISWRVLAKGEVVEKSPALAAKMSKSFWDYYPTYWHDRYDYLAVRHLGCDKDIPARPDLVFAGQSETYKLYRILRN